jgi:Tudor domain
MILADLNVLKELMREVQIRYADTEPDLRHRWHKGQPSVAKFSEDGMFYRAEVTDVRDNGSVEVC